MTPPVVADHAEEVVVGRVGGGLAFGDEVLEGLVDVDVEVFANAGGVERVFRAHASLIRNWIGSAL